MSALQEELRRLLVGCFGKTTSGRHWRIESSAAGRIVESVFGK
jgi:hypothetical protein